MRKCTQIYRLFVLAMMLGVLLAATPFLAPGKVLDGNAGREGQEVDLNKLVARGYYTLVDFWSPYCGPCLQIAPILEKMSKRKKNLVVVKLNINRPEVQGIDWNSPLAKQHNIRSVPYMVIYDPKGKVLAQGAQALQTLAQWAKELGL